MKTDQIKLKDKKILWVLETPPHPVVLHMQIWKIKKLINEDKIVDVVVCGSAVGACIANPLAIKLICNYCEKQVRKSFENISANLIFADEVSQKKYNIENENIINSRRSIWNVDSVFISKFRQNPVDTNSIFLKKSYDSLEIAYNNMMHILSKIANNRIYKEIWTFNERGINCGAAIATAKLKEIPYAALELSGRDYMVAVAYNRSAYEPQFWTDEYLKMMAKTSRKEIIKGKEFFENKIKGIWTVAPAFVIPKKVQTDITILKEIDILFLYSSEDEFAALGDKWKRFYGTQEDVCLRVRERFPKLRISVKFHPNQDDIPKKLLIKKLNLLGENGITCYKPKDEYTSYDLISKSKIIITFGSTMGYEAVYQMRKVIQVDSSWFSGLQIISQADSFSELFGYIDNPNKISIKKYRALSLGYFLMRFKTEECDQAYVTDYFINPKKSTLLGYLCKISMLFELIIARRPILPRIKLVITRYYKKIYIL